MTTDPTLGPTRALDAPTRAVAQAPATPPGSPDASRRLPALDVLRGIAILGTLMTNIWIFSGVTSTMGDADLAAAGLRSVPEQIFDTMLSLTTDGKYIGLLTIMFGIGLEIQRQSALRKGETWPGAYPWRAGLFILDGLLNYIFIFEFDVLMGYGLTGLVVAFVMAGSPARRRSGWASAWPCTWRT